MRSAPEGFAGVRVFGLFPVAYGAGPFREHAGLLDDPLFSVLVRGLGTLACFFTLFRFVTCVVL